MIASPQQPLKMTIAEYLEWESRQEVRHEYVNGEVYAVTGVPIPYNDIALNLYKVLCPHLRSVYRPARESRGCRINVSDVKVAVSMS